MPTHVTYTAARANFAKLWDEAVSTREPIFISRRGKEEMALIPANELSGLLETAHLLRSPKNADRLLSTLVEARRGDGKVEPVSNLRRDLGFDDD